MLPLQQRKRQQLYRHAYISFYVIHSITLPLTRKSLVSDQACGTEMA